mmetsp:Transcript_27256/g.73258  ORF Transcript_27256/g.73258 Transcript_27256/m.73258 type:complete len:200 (+) Transcript_27256:82-681(+)
MLRPQPRQTCPAFSGARLPPLLFSPPWMEVSTLSSHPSSQAGPIGSFWRRLPRRLPCHLPHRLPSCQWARTHRPRPRVMLGMVAEMAVSTAVCSRGPFAVPSSVSLVLEATAITSGSSRPRAQALRRVEWRWVWIRSKRIHSMCRFMRNVGCGGAGGWWAAERIEGGRIIFCIPGMSGALRSGCGCGSDSIWCDSTRLY